MGGSGHHVQHCQECPAPERDTNDSAGWQQVAGNVVIFVPTAPVVVGPLQPELQPLNVSA